jgi:dystrophin
LINISANDIVEGNPKLTLGLVWNIIQHWQVRDVLRSAVYDIHTTNLEKALLTWCQNSTKGYAGVNIKDFTDSWKDGLAFNALIHKYRPHLFNYNDLFNNMTKYGSKIKFAESNLEHAFSIAQKNLQIERLLDIEDLIGDYPDKKSIMMYVMCYFQVLSKPMAIIDEINHPTQVSFIILLLIYLFISNLSFQLKKTHSFCNHFILF